MIAEESSPFSIKNMEFITNPTPAYGTCVTCAYIDASVLPLVRLGELHERLVNGASWWPPAEAFSLLTCQRVEVYSIGPPPQLADLGEMAQLLDSLAVRRRLAEIAAGLRSQLLGERFILSQVERAAAFIPDEHWLAGTVAEAVKVARQVREVHDFAAVADYPDLACRLLPMTKRGLSVVVGSGMLARAVADRLLENGAEMIMVTRSPKRLRKRLAGRIPQAKVVNYFQLADVLGGRPYSMVLATAQLTVTLRDRLLELFSASNCSGTVDLCSVPVCSLAPPATRYVTMYDPEFLALVSEANAELHDRSNRVRSDIAAYYQRELQ